MQETFNLNLSAQDTQDCSFENDGKAETIHTSLKNQPGVI